jgi:hypothetical protein
MGSEDMSVRLDCSAAAQDALYELAMQRICDLRSDAQRGREYRRTLIGGGRPR